MLLMQKERMIAFTFMVLALLAFGCARCHAHAVLLLEEPYGFFGIVFPSGHSAIYFEQVCAETPVKLRRCRPGEFGAVITRNPGIGKYDWVAIPLVPYLYSVENPTEVPAHADSKAVWKMRNRYHEAHLLSLGEKMIPGNLVRGGWSALVGQAYERRIYAFSFETTFEQDDALIARMNADKNHSHFDFLYNNCSDFARFVLNVYFPGYFPRNISSDAGMTSPKAVARKLVRFARKHPEMQLAVYEIPQVPGYRRHSHRNKDLIESLITTPYVLPITLANPYLAGGLLVDYLVRSHSGLIPKNPPVVAPDNLYALTVVKPAALNSDLAESGVSGAELNSRTETPIAAPRPTNPSETMSRHE
jgi:hypothetical protein